MNKINIRSLQLRDLKELSTRRGIAWNATLFLEGKPFMKVENEGTGGSCTYRAFTMSNKEFQPILRELERQAAVRTAYTLEALDHLCACAEEGDYLGQKV